MLGSLITNSIKAEAECGEFLQQRISDILLYKDSINAYILLRFVVKYWQNIELLHHEFHLD